MAQRPGAHLAEPWWLRCLDLGVISPALGSAASAPNSRRRALAPWAWAVGVYLLVDLMATGRFFWHGARSTSICGCGDPAGFIWLFAWPAHAIAHLQNPFYSTALMYPDGWNLLSQTSVMGLTLPLVPVTWLLGPVFSFNLAIFLVPLANALAAFAFARRFTRSSVPALGAGLLYGFSPFVMGAEAFGHLQVSAAFVFPLVAACLDELFRTRRHRPVQVGLVLGLLLSYQFFLSTEMLLLGSLALAPAMVLLVAWCVRKEGWRAPSLRGLAAAGATSLVLLAGPAAYALLGPGHLSGPVWLDANARNGSLWSDLLGSGPSQGPNLGFKYLMGGLLGSIPRPNYIGPLVVAAAVLALWFRRRAASLWLMAGLALWAVLLSLSDGQPAALWPLLYRLPLLNSAVQLRFPIFTLLAVCTLAAAGVDELLTRAVPAGRRPSAVVRLGIAGALTAVTFVPSLLAEHRSFSLENHPVLVPRWFKIHGRHQPPGTVILAFPSPYSYLHEAMVWQAVNEMAWSQPGAFGPSALAKRAGRLQLSVELVRRFSSTSFDPEAKVSDAKIVAGLRAGLEAWGVTKIVVPLDFGEPFESFRTDPVWTSAVVTSTLGVAPRQVDGAFVWNLVPPRRP